MVLVVVDGLGVDPPTAEWLQAAQRAAETDGILENTSTKRQKVRNASTKFGCTLILMSLALQIGKPCTQTSRTRVVHNLYKMS